MIIKELVIYGYGKWVDQHFSFATPLQAIYGPNEAGKSTIIDFIESMLFGFQNKKQAVHGQFYPKTSKAYGGELIFEQGHQNYKLVRIDGPKGGNVKFFDIDHDIELPSADFEALLSPIDRQSYNQLFYFGDFDKKEFYKTDETDLGLRIQRIGVTDADKWAGLQKELSKMADELYKPRGRKQQINVKLKDYHELEQKVQDAKKAYPAYLNLQSKLDDVTANYAHQHNELLQLQRHIQADQQLESYLPLIRERSELAKISENDLLTGFDDTDEAIFDRYRADITSVIAQVKDNQKQVDEIKKASSETPAQHFYEENQFQIDALMGDLAGQRNVASRIQLMSSQRDKTQEKLLQLKASLPKNEAGELPLPFPNDQMNHINELLRQQGNLKDQLRNGESRTTRRPKPAKKSLTPYYVIAGIIALVAILVSQHAVISIIGYLMALGILGWGFTQQRNQSRDQFSSQPITDQQALNRQLAVIQNQLQQISSDYRLSGIEEAKWFSIQSALHQVDDLQQSLSENNHQLEAEQKKYEHYLDQWQFARDWIHFDPDAYTHNLDLLEQTVNHWQQQFAEFRQKQKNLVIFQNLVDQTNAKLTQTKKQVTDFLTQRAVHSEDEFKRTLAQQKQLREKLRRKAELNEQLEGANINMPNDLDESKLKTKLDQERQRLDDLQRSVNNMSEQKAELNVQLTHLVESGHYFDLRQQLANLETDILDDLHRYLALQLSTRWIQNVLNIATKGRVPKILKLAKQYFATLTDHQYKNILFENEISVVRKDDVAFTVNELSKGTLEQLYLALILSMTVGFSDQYPLPIMIDDGFVNFDKTRRQAAFAILKQVSQKTQVLYFTANDEIRNHGFEVLDLSQF